MLRALQYNAKRLGLSPGDSPDEKVLKANLTTIVVTICILSFIWAMIYFSLGLYLAGFLGLTFTVASTCAMFIFQRTKKRSYLVGIVLPFVFLLALMEQVVIGGLYNSGFMALWCMLCPIGSLLFQDVKSSVFWFIAFVIAAIIMICFDEVFRHYFTNDLGAGIKRLFMILNVVCLFGVIFIAVSYYVSENEKEKKKSDRLLDLAHQHRRQMEFKNAELNKSLLERDVLLKEIHHRVKNNMQVITSLLSLQAGYIGDEKTKALFRYSQYRIASMAIVHEMLYHSQNLGQIRYADYLKRLINQLAVSMKGTENNIALKIEVPEIFLNIDTAIPLGLMINEIITNSLKYAFRGTENNEIYIRICAHGENNFTMFIGDNGVGFPETVSFRETGSLGVLLMHNLALQLEGGIEKVNQPGTHYIINFKEISQTT